VSDEDGGVVRVLDELIVDVDGRPATFATAGEGAWRTAVGDAVGAREVPDGVRFEVEIDFRLPLAVRANDAWDLDNLIKPTLDALGGAIGWRRWKGRPQVDDERVDRIVASKRPVRAGERTGARIRISVLPTSGTR
jgi:Holliday junction resolvase RusA-like endonuclease